MARFLILVLALLAGVVWLLGGAGADPMVDGGLPSAADVAVADEGPRGPMLWTGVDQAAAPGPRRLVDAWARAMARSVGDAIDQEAEVEIEVDEEDWTPPRDVLQHGDATLEVTVFDGDTGARVHTPVALWRLDAPANDYYTRGDQLQGSTSAGRDRPAVFERLPEGRYRLSLRDLRFGIEDPEPFEVKGRMTRLRVALLRPLKRRVHVVLYDEAGTMVSSARIRSEYSDYWEDDCEACWKDEDLVSPDWVARRRLQNYSFDPYEVHVDWEVGTGPGEDGPIVANDRGFDLGHRWQDDGRVGHTIFHREFTIDGKSAVAAGIHGEHRRDRRYVGLVVDMEKIASRIFMPDGRRADAAGARVEAYSESVLEPEGHRDVVALTRDVSLCVSVSLAGYEELKFHFKPLIEGWRWERQLVPEADE